MPRLESDYTRASVTMQIPQIPLPRKAIIINPLPVRDPFYINKTEILPIGTLISVQKLNDNSVDKSRSSYYKIDKIKKLADGKNPESKDNIEIEKTYDAELPNDQKFFSFIQEYKIDLSSPLFPNQDSPKIDEIAQYLIPDCFLLAVIQSILDDEEGGKKFIRGMLWDHDNGTVTVRLFDPQTQNPFYITVPRARLIENGYPLNRHKALWVYILETAYAALGVRLDGKEEVEYVGAGQSVAFSGGGKRCLAFRILTGKNSEAIRTDLSKDNKTLALVDAASVKGMHSLRQVLKEDEKLSADAQDKLRKTIIIFFKNEIKIGLERLYGKIPGDNKIIKIIDQYLDFYDQHMEECDAICDAEQPDVEKMKKLLRLLENTHAPEILCQLIYFMQEELEACLLIPFSGNYSKKALDLYKKIEENIQEENCITAGTRTKEELENCGFSLLPGIPEESHAYSIHNVSFETRWDPPRKIFYIYVRNPWGTQGMSYIKDDIPVEDSNKPFFKIELNDFYKTMNDIAILKKDKLFSFDKKRHDFIGSIKDIRELNYSAGLSIRELLQYKKELDYANSKFFEMEFVHLEEIPIDVKEKIYEILCSEEPDEEQEKKILHMLKERNIHANFYHGKIDCFKEHIHLLNLLKLQKLFNEKSNDYKLILALQEKIIFSGSHSFKIIIKHQQNLKNLIKEKCKNTSYQIRIFKKNEFKTIEEKFAKIKEIKETKEQLEKLGFTCCYENIQHSYREIEKDYEDLLEIQIDNAIKKNALITSVLKELTEKKEYDSFSEKKICRIYALLKENKKFITEMEADLARYYPLGLENMKKSIRCFTSEINSIREKSAHASAISMGMFKDSSAKQGQLAPCAIRNGVVYGGKFI